MNQVTVNPQSNDFLYRVVTPENTDVLCGRGGGSLRHPGNISYRRLVMKNKISYATSTKPEKINISKSIVDAVRRRDPPGHFLEQDRETKIWTEIGDKRAVEKTSQALREGQSNIRKNIENQTNPYKSSEEVLANKSQVYNSFSHLNGISDDVNVIYDSSESNTHHFSIADTLDVDSLLQSDTMDMDIDHDEINHLIYDTFVLRQERLYKDDKNMLDADKNTFTNGYQKSNLHSLSETYHYPRKNSFMKATLSHSDMNQIALLKNLTQNDYGKKRNSLVNRAA